MGSMMKRLALATAVLGLAGSASQVRATSLLPGEVVVPSLLATSPNDATFLADTGMQNFDVTQDGVNLAGSARAVVADNYASNPWGLNALTFLYQVTLTSSSPDGEGIANLIMSSFAGFSTDVGFYQEGDLKDPVDASRSEGVGADVSFNFLPGVIVPGEQTSVLIINTNATAYSLGKLTIQGGATVTLGGFGAASLIPEPAAIVGATTGLVLVGGYSLRRRSKSSRAV